MKSLTRDAILEIKRQIFAAVASVNSRYGRVVAYEPRNITIVETKPPVTYHNKKDEKPNPLS